MAKKSCLLTLLVLAATLYSFNASIFAQTYTIKPIITETTKFFSGVNLRIKTIYGHDLSINNKGDIVFSASLRNTLNNATPRGIILFSNKTAKLIAIGNRGPDFNKGEFHDVNAPDINDNGTVVFSGISFIPDGAFKQTIYKLAENETIPVVSPGDHVHGLDAIISNVAGGRISLNNNGDIAFAAILSNGLRGLFLFTNDGGIEPIILEGDPFPVFNGDETLLGAGSPVINDKGEIVFLGSFLRTDDVPDNQSPEVSGVFLFREGEIIPVKLPGQEAPGTGEMVFRDDHLSAMTIGANSRVVFRGDYLIPNGASDDRKIREGGGLFSWTEGEPNPLILPGAKALGVRGNLLFFRGTLTKDTLNDRGEMVASFATRDLGGLFLISKGNIKPVFLTKKPIPGMEEVIFTGTAAINNRGDIVFFGKDIFNSDIVFLARNEK